jgi:pyruvate dehydrogenase E2 component (dihydrolipoamide acetyltransferase)
MATPVIMPKFEMSQEAATVLEWLAAEGDAVQQGQPLLEVETDKVTMEIEAPASGVLAQISARPGDVVPVTQVIATILKPGEHAAAVGGERGAGSGAHATARREQGTVSGERVTAAAGQSDQVATLRPRATPLARRLAHAAGIDLAGVAGSGPRGRIQAADVRSAAADVPAQAPAIAREPAPIQPGAAVEIGAPPLEPFSGMRAAIARRMTESYQQAPHIHLTRSVDVTAAEAARQRWAEIHGERISLTVLLARACAWALRRHPAVNATVEPASVRRWPEINIGVAVALPEGLIVPVLRRADARPLGELAQELAALAEQARAGGLRPDQVSDGTFTLTNLGMFGVEAFDPILNPPQAAILGAGAVVERVVPRDGQIVIRPLMQLTLAADHRALDGAAAALFLQDICRAIEDPAAMLL